MEYLCKNCIHNNNGWCKKRRIQGLKGIVTCDFKETKDIQPIKKIEVKSDEMSDEAYKNYGKRDFFYNMQRQIIAMEAKGEKSISIDDLKELMIALDQTLKISESLFGVKFDSMIDRDIFNDSNRIIEAWKSEKLRNIK